MVRWVAVFLLSFASLSAWAQTSLILGESVTLNLRSAQTHQDYAKLDLSPLKADFHLDDSAQTSDRIRLKLTPYKVGTFQIPHLQSGDLVIESQTIEVLPNPQVKIDWGTPREQAYQGQWLSWKIRVELADAGLPVSLRASPHSSVLVSETPLDQQIGQSKIARFVQAQQFTELGEHQAESPDILVQNRQGTRWQFFAPQHQVEVKALPSYLPADIGVGHYELQVERPWFYITGELNRMQLIMQATDANYLSDVRGLLQTGEGIEWLNPQRELRQTLQAPGLVMLQTIDQPYRILNSGWGEFAELRLNVLNPQSGKLEVVKLEAQPYIAMPKWLAWILGVLLGLLALVVVYGLGQVIKIAFYRLRLLWQLKQAKTPQAVWQAYQTWGQARGLGTPQTHQAWLSAYQAGFGESPTLQKRFKTLDEALYK